MSYSTSSITIDDFYSQPYLLYLLKWLVFVTHSLLIFYWTKMVTCAYQTWAWPVISPRRSHTPACKSLCCNMYPSAFSRRFVITDCNAIGGVQWYSRLHGTGGAGQGNVLRLQRWLVLVWLHALQTAPGVRTIQHLCFKCYNWWHALSERNLVLLTEGYP